MSKSPDLLWVSPLLARYRERVASGDVADEQVDAFSTLRLADALLRARQRHEQTADLPPSIAVLGPTQSGKSSLVNVLLDADLAGISALAGFTVHAQGFATDCSDRELETLAAVMDPLERASRSTLTREGVDQYSLESVAAGPGALLTRGIVWDSPDFDSLEARGYLEAVLKCVAASDVIILVVSRDKYGDRSVWQMLHWLHALGRPIIVCINKLNPGDESTVTQSFQRRWESEIGRGEPSVVGLTYYKGGGLSLSSLDAPHASALRDALDKAVASRNRSEQRLTAQRFIDKHRAEWLRPVQDELEAVDRWSSLLGVAVDEAETAYVQGYLEDPEKYDTFNRALAELLTLLEIPGLAATLAKARQLVTWPARTLLGLGRTALNNRMRPASDAPDRELETLELIADRWFSRVQRALSEQADASVANKPWWRAMINRFREDRDEIRDEYMAAALRARAEFEPRIDAAAQQLHERLKAQPRLLNTLRAARVTGDAAGVALAVKSGGLAPADLVLAPAMLSVTTLLTESALGRYLDTIKRDLQREQQALVRERLLEGVLQARLAGLADELDRSQHFVSGLDERVLQAARTASR